MSNIGSVISVISHILFVQNPKAQEKTLELRGIRSIKQSNYHVEPLRYIHQIELNSIGSLRLFKL